MILYAVHSDSGKLVKWNGGTSKELNEETLSGNLDQVKEIAKTVKGRVIAYKATFHYAGPIDSNILVS